MEQVTVRVPATTANLGPGFDAFGCALSLYTHVTFTKIDAGLVITGCDDAYAGADNLAYVAYCAALKAMGREISGVRIHIDAQIPISRGLGSSAALLIAGAMGANALHGNPLSLEALLAITNAIEGHPDNLAPALYGGLMVSMVADGKPVTARFPLCPDWEFLALVPDFTLSTSLARQALPAQYSRADAVYNISHAAMVLKALETGEEGLLSLALQDKIHQPYRKSLIRDYERIEALVTAAGGAFCISGAGPTLLCITRDPGVKQALALPEGWKLLPLKAQTQGARVL